MLLRAGAGLAGTGGLSLAAHAQTTSNALGLAAWGKIESVIEFPRCLNCHQENVPLQGDMGRVHIPLVVRGLDNDGVSAMRCGNGHNPNGSNDTSDALGVKPGSWQLAPVSMMWQGFSSGELCQMLKDKSRNGAAIIQHTATEPLATRCP